LDILASTDGKVGLASKSGVTAPATSKTISDPSAKKKDTALVKQPHRAEPVVPDVSVEQLMAEVAQLTLGASKKKEGSTVSGISKQKQAPASTKTAPPPPPPPSSTLAKQPDERVEKKPGWERYHIKHISVHPMNA